MNKPTNKLKILWLLCFSFIFVAGFLLPQVLAFASDHCFHFEYINDINTLRKLCHFQTMIVLYLLALCFAQIFISWFLNKRD